MIDDIAQVIRFEQRGCGRSDPIGPYDVATCIQDLESIRQHYAIDRWIVGGHSWGPNLALAYALQYPERVAGLIALAGGRIHNDRERHAAYKQNLAQRGETEPDYAYPPNMDVNQQVGRSWKQYIQQPLLFKRVAQLAVPALFIYGELDIRPAWPIEQLAHLLPNGRFELIHGASHCIWLSHADEVRGLLRDFICSISATV